MDPAIGDPHHWLGVHLKHMLDSLGDFATVSEVSVTTGSGGEDAEMVSFDTDAVVWARMKEILAEHADVEVFDIDLTLQCRTPEGALPVELGAHIWLEIDHDTARSSPLHLVFVLDVDIYAYQTWGVQRDNHVLAALNGPLLRGFMERLTSKPGTRVWDIDAPSYRGQVGPLGFLQTS
jgi:hypothetical protein